MGKILVVDDQPHIVRLLQLELERAQHTVVTAGDGEEGLEQFRAEKPDLVVLDVVMPKKDGSRSCARFAPIPTAAGPR